MPCFGDAQTLEDLGRTFAYAFNGEHVGGGVPHLSFFRIGGPHLGKAKVSLEVNSNDVILDDIRAWRADHGSGVGWIRPASAAGR